RSRRKPSVPRRSRWVAARKRTSMATGLVDPTRSTSRASIARRSLACRPGAISPISSRRRVPPAAASRRPALAWTAPVKAPRSWRHEHERDRPAAEALADADLALLAVRQALAAVLRAIAAAEIADGARRAEPQPQVVARDLGMIEGDLAVAAAADDDLARLGQ